MLRRVRRVLLVIVISILVLSTEDTSLRVTPLDRAAIPYHFNLISWEAAHLLDKWLHKFGEALPRKSRAHRRQEIALVREFFSLAQELQDLQSQLRFPFPTLSNPLTEAQARSLPDRAKWIEERRRQIQALVEETLEAEISAVLALHGFARPFGLIFPPVDTVLSEPPHVLVLSPRDRISLLRTTLMTSSISDEAKGKLEQLALGEENLSAVVEATGGVAGYPSVVADIYGLHHAMTTIAHEWLHQWFFFRPLGRHFYSSIEMTTLNETAATLGGNEIGDQAFQAITGEKVTTASSSPVRDPSAFDFNAEMRRTRLRAEELLSQGRIEEAEAYMEERRRFMDANGYRIRKINQAYFAFHGVYAGTPASISPIESQLRELRGLTPSLGDFLRTVARFSSYQEFLDHLERARAGPASALDAPHSLLLHSPSAN